jgi:nucleoside 2-deoxyribosyltransferase
MRSGRLTSRHQPLDHIKAWRRTLLVYIAAPLFNEAEREFNLKVDDLVSNLGLTTFLPQRDAGDAAKLLSEGGSPDEVKGRLFDLDYANVRACDVLLFLIDGRSPDEGSCVELGMAYALGKPCIGFQTDSRRFAPHGNNVMIDGSLLGVAGTWDELSDLLKSVVSRLSATG